jgi:hypothetical protein
MKNLNIHALKKLEPTGQKINRSLMCAAVYTRANIAFHIGRLSQQLQDPVERHSSGVKEIGRYLGTTTSQTIRYGSAKQTNLDGQNIDTSSCLKLYSDVDWARMIGRKIISGHVALLYGGPISWGVRDRDQ